MLQMNIRASGDKQFEWPHEFSSRRELDTNGVTTYIVLLF